jgi:hypothetical protein
MVKQQVIDLQRQNSLGEDDLFGIGFAIASYRVDGTLQNACWATSSLFPCVRCFVGYCNAHP